VRGQPPAEIRFELLQRETQLEKSVYDGMVTALAIVEDVRAQDIVDYSFSVPARTRSSRKVRRHLSAQRGHADPRAPRADRISGSAGCTSKPPAPSVSDGKREGQELGSRLILAEQAPLPEKTGFPRGRTLSSAAGQRSTATGRKFAPGDGALRVQQQLSPELLASRRKFAGTASRAKSGWRATLKFVQEQIRYFAVGDRDQLAHAEPQRDVRAPAMAIARTRRF